MRQGKLKSGGSKITVANVEATQREERSHGDAGHAGALNCALPEAYAPSPSLQQLLQARRHRREKKSNHGTVVQTLKHQGVSVHTLEWLQPTPVAGVSPAPLLRLVWGLRQQTQLSGPCLSTLA